MFNRLKAITKNTKKLKTKVIFRIVFQNSEIQDLVLDLNRVEQLFKKGIDSVNDEIGFYSEVTEQLSKGQSFGFGGDSGTKQKKAGEPIFLLDEGEFYKSFKIKIFNDGFTINADTLKDDGTDLAQSYGKEILGLTNESKTEIITKILPFVVEETRKIIRG